MAESISDKTKAILFSSPCNPTGSVYSIKELTALAEVIKKHPNIAVISDEIYEYINFTPSHFSIAQVDGMTDQVIVVNGFSKGFAMTGWRLGYIGAPAHIAAACQKIQGQFTSGANAFSQQAAIQALEKAREESRKMTSIFLQRRDYFISALDEIEGFKVNYPLGAFYVFPDISYFFGKKFEDQTIESANDFSELLLTKAHVATVSGIAFGNENCIRLSYAASQDELLTAIERIKKFVASIG